VVLSAFETRIIYRLCATIVSYVSVVSKLRRLGNYVIICIIFTESQLISLYPCSFCAKLSDILITL